MIAANSHSKETCEKGDLRKFNGTGNFSLPIPATLVVDTDGKIAFAHVDVDYATRANPEDVLSVVRNISSSAMSRQLTSK